MSPSIGITAPPIHKPIVDATPGVTTIVHAPVDGRFGEAALAAAIAKASAGMDSIVIVKEGNRLRFLLDSWLETLQGVKRRTLKSDGLSGLGKTIPGGGTVWILEGEPVRPKTLPMRKPDCAFIVDAHLLDFRPETNADVEVVIGEMPEGSHWFMSLTREQNGAGYRYDDEDICSCFPDQDGEGISKIDPAYERMMKLKDVKVDYGDQSFDGFAEDRLFVKSDKPLEGLTARQQVHAKDQLSQKQRILPFDIHEGQKVYMQKKRQILEERGGKPWFIVLKSRRIGITAVEQALSYRIAVTQPFSDVATLAHKWESTQRIFGMVSMFHLKDPRAPKLRTQGSRSALQFANGSNFFIGTAGGEGFLRGDGVARVHWSEVSKSCRGPQQMAKVEDLWSGLCGAASHGEITLETTANGREWFYLNYMDAKAGLNELKPIFLRWFDDPLNRLQSSEFNPDEIKDTLTDKEIGLVEEFHLDISQVAFRRQAQRIYKRLFPQEMPEDDASCFLSSGVCFFDIDVIRTLMETVIDSSPMYRRFSGGYEIRWEDPVPGRKYVLGADTSEGIPGRDRAGFGILDKETGAQVCSVHGYFRPKTLAELIFKFGCEYNNALAGVERNNHGHAVLLRLEELGYPYNRPHFRGGSMFYYWKGNEIKTSRAGWNTDAQSRPVMLDHLADALHEGSIKVRCREFVDECSSFNLQQNGKFEADQGAHDDHVIKWAIAWAMRETRMPKPTITVLNGTTR